MKIKLLPVCFLALYVLPVLPVLPILPVLPAFAQGMNNSTDTKLTGKEAHADKHKEAFAETGGPGKAMYRMDAAPPGLHSRRMRLEPKERAECHSLDRSITELETSERNARYLRLREIQQELLSRRERHHELGC